jgi:rSAM/selenodomain-associated transferase 2
LSSLRVSIVIPALNEAAGIGATLDALQALRVRGVELVLVDGGSSDSTAALSRPWVDQLVRTDKGRALQMNAGAAVARGDVLVFLHADTRLPPLADALVLRAIEAGASWGRFDVVIESNVRLLRLVAWLMNMRSRLGGIATGDQAIFVTRKAFTEAGGFPAQPLMEDIELSRRLKRAASPVCLREKVCTSGRRWEQRGVLRTVLLMWWLRWRYWCGACPQRLARAYR